MKKFFLMFLLLGVFFISSCGVVTNSAIAGKAIDFNAKNMNGEKVALSEYIGKEPIFLIFFATWCPPCKAEVPKLIKMQDKYKDKGLKIIATSVDNSSKVLSSFISKMAINYEVWHDTFGEGARAYKISGIPTNILIDKNGNVIYREYYLPDEKKIDNLL